MNDRIRAFAEQAGFIDKSNPAIQYFAELIVRECERILIENVEVALDASGNPVSPEDFIKEHFGVE